HDSVLGEHLPPLAKRLVAGQQDRMPLLVTLGDRLKQQARFSRLKPQVTDFVYDQQLGSGQIVDLAMQPVIGHRLCEPANHLAGSGEKTPTAPPTSPPPNRNPKLVFPHPGGPKKEDVAPLKKKPPLLKPTNHPPVQRRLRGVIELLEPLCVRKLRELK